MLQAPQAVEPPTSSAIVNDADVEMAPSTDTAPAVPAIESPLHMYDDAKGHDNVVVSYIDVFGKVSLALVFRARGLRLIAMSSFWRATSNMCLTVAISWPAATAWNGWAD